jgi:hypothetical protein
MISSLAVNVKVATVLGSIPASSDTGVADEAVLNNVHKKILKIPPLKNNRDLRSCSLMNLSDRDLVIVESYRVHLLVEIFT